LIGALIFALTTPQPLWVATTKTSCGIPNNTFPLLDLFLNHRKILPR